MKFRGTLNGVATKPNKDMERVTVLQIAVESTREITGELSLMVGSTIEVEVNQPAWYRQNHGSQGEAQKTIDQHLNEECAVCGHARGDHKVDPKVCLGDGGACVCDEFIAREEAEKESGETAPVMAVEIPPGAVCAICGHVYSLHTEDYCKQGLHFTDGVRELGETAENLQCPCPGFQAVDPNTETLAAKQGLCADCGHARSDHRTETGCMVNLDSGDIDAEIVEFETCRCVRVYLPDGTPDGLVGDHDDERKKAKRGRKSKRAVAA